MYTCLDAAKTVVGSRHRHSTSASRKAVPHLMIRFKIDLPFLNLNIRKGLSTRAFPLYTASVIHVR